MHREVEQFEETHVLREESEVYGFKSAVFWNEKLRRCQDIGGSDPATKDPLFPLCCSVDRRFREHREKRRVDHHLV